MMLSKRNVPLVFKFKDRFKPIHSKSILKELTEPPKPPKEDIDDAA